MITTGKFIIVLICWRESEIGFTDTQPRNGIRLPTLIGPVTL